MRNVLDRRVPSWVITLALVLGFAVVLLAVYRTLRPPPVKPEGEIHLIPKNYRGSIYYIFDIPSGTPLRYENGARVYEVPQSGVVVTSAPLNEHFGTIKYYFVDGDGHRTPIKDFWRGSFDHTPEERADPRIYILGMEVGTYRADIDSCEITLWTYYVGTKADALDHRNLFQVEDYYRQHPLCPPAAEPKS